MFLTDSILTLRYAPSRFFNILKQCELVGLQSVYIVVQSGIFLGAVLGYQLYVAMHRFGSEGLLGGTLSISLFRELGPVMTGIVVSGRAGAAIAAEISSMKISEQLDSLEILAVDPLEYLVMPRILASFIMLPILSFILIICASQSASWVACHIMGLQKSIFWGHYFKLLTPIDLMHTVIKSGFFGTLFSTIGCFCGFRAFGGARAVGRATMSSVVSSSLMILLFDYMLTSFLPLGLHTLQMEEL